MAPSRLLYTTLSKCLCLCVFVSRQWTCGGVASTLTNTAGVRCVSDGRREKEAEKKKWMHCSGKWK